MNTALRRALARLLFLTSERGIVVQRCVCTRPVDPLVTPAIQKAIEEIERLLALEPELPESTDELQNTS